MTFYNPVMKLTDNGPHVTWRLPKHVIFGEGQNRVDKKRGTWGFRCKAKTRNGLKYRASFKVWSQSSGTLSDRHPQNTHRVSRVGSYALLCPGCWFSSLTFQRGFRHHHNQQINTCQSAETHMGTNIRAHSSTTEWNARCAKTALVWRTNW